MEQESKKTVILENIRQRRSTRNFIQKPMADEALNRIVEAGRYAPSGNNSQATHFFVITSAEKLAQLRGVMTKALAETPEYEGMPPHFLGMVKRAKKETVDVTYGAPTLIVTAGKKGSPNTIADCSCALQNMMLAASAIGIGNVWINQYFLLRENQLIRFFFAELGLSENEDICGALALGYSEKIADTPLPRTGFPVTYIR